MSSMFIIPSLQYVEKKLFEIDKLSLDAAVWEAFLQTCRSVLEMGEPGKAGSLKALPAIAEPAPQNLTEDDSVPPLPGMGRRRKFSLFGLFPQASDYKSLEQSSANCDQLSPDKSLLTPDTKVSQHDQSDREAKALARSSSWSNFITSSLSRDVYSSSPTNFNDHFTFEPAIPSAYSTGNTTTQAPSGVSDCKPELSNSMQSLQLTQAVSNHPLFSKQTFAQNGGLLTLPDTPSIHKTQSSSALETLKNDVQVFKSSTKPTMPPPPPKPRKVRVRKQEINMFAPTSM